METGTITAIVVTSLLKTGVFFMVLPSAWTVVTWFRRRRRLGEALYRARVHWAAIVVVGILAIFWLITSVYVAWCLLDAIGAFPPSESALYAFGPPKHDDIPMGFADMIFCFMALIWSFAILGLFEMARFLLIGQEFGRLGVCPSGHGIVPWKRVSRAVWKKSHVLLLNDEGTIEQSLLIPKCDRVAVDAVLRQCVPSVEEADSGFSPRISARQSRRTILLTLLFFVVLLANGAYLLGEAQRECHATGILHDSDVFVMQFGVYVDSVNFDSARKPTKEQLQLLSHFRGLTAVELQRTSIDDASMQYLPPLKTLQKLDLSYTSLSDAGLAPLAGLTSMRHLRLVDTKVTGAGMRHLEGLHRLRSLEMWGVPMTREGLVSIGNLHELRILDLGATPVRDEWLEPLGDLSKLEQLSLIRTKITGAGLRHLEPLVDLRQLWLCETEIDDDGLRSLASLSSLERLWLSDTPVNGTGLASLACLTKLDSLGLQDTRITDAGVEALAQLKSLTYLDLDGAQITDAGVASLASLPNLEHLYIKNAQLTQAGITALAKCRRLAHLTLEGNQVTDATAPAFRRMTHLRSIQFIDTRLSANAVEEIRRALPHVNINWDDPAAEEWKPPEHSPEKEGPSGMGEH